MKDKIKKDILSVLDKSIIAIKRNNVLSLRDQSNCTIHNSAIFQDKYSISTAVVIYSIYKLIEKNKFRQYSGWSSFERLLLSELKRSIGKINRNNFSGYLISLRKITQGMIKLDRNVGSFIDHVIHVTKIKKATRMHEHGISTLRVAKLLGVPSWEVMSYLGHTKTFDNPLNLSKSVSDRLDLAKKIFNVK